MMVIRSIFYGGTLIMKMKITVEIENDDGSKTIKPVVVDTEVPNYEEFKGPDNFRETFDILEKAALKVRNEAVETAIEKYLAELSKKKPVGQSRKKKER
jgi:hypothetical protein